MSSISDYLENTLLNAVVRNTTYTSPSTVYLALFSSSTGLEEGTLTNELTGGGYARQAVTFSAPSNGVVTNSGNISFPEATSDWATIRGMAIMDASTGGNVLFSTATGSKDVLTGDTLIILDTELSITLD